MTAFALLGGRRGKNEGPQDVASIPLLIWFISEYSVIYGNIITE